MTDIQSNGAATAANKAKARAKAEAKSKVAPAAKPSMAEVYRTALDKAEKVAAKNANVTSLEEARAKAVDGHGRAEGAARVYAHKLRAAFGADYYTLTKVNTPEIDPETGRQSQDYARFVQIEAERVACEAMAKARGLRYPGRPWTAAMQEARKLDGATTRTARKLIIRQKAALIALYKAAMKEERPSERENAVNVLIGNILRAQFSVDLSIYNNKE